jgi:choline kinase
MKAVILAGGQGTRLKPITNEKPKCMVEVGSRPILAYQIESLLNLGIDEIIIVVGYKKEKISEYIKTNFPNENITLITNDDFMSTGPVDGLKISFDYVRNNDFIYLNSDVVFDRRILKKVLESEYKSCTAIQQTDWDEEEVNVIYDENYSITNISKDIDKDSTMGEFIGVTKISKNFLKEMSNLFNTNPRGTFFFAVDLIKHTIQNADQKIYALDVKGLESIEIDTVNDLEKAEEKIKRIENE